MLINQYLGKFKISSVLFSFMVNDIEKNKFFNVLNTKVKDQKFSISSLLILSAKLKMKKDPER